MSSSVAYRLPVTGRSVNPAIVAYLGDELTTHDGHLEIPPFPAPRVRPEKREADPPALFGQDGDIQVFDPQRRRRGARIFRRAPVVPRPMEKKRGPRLDAKDEPRPDHGNLAVMLPDFHRLEVPPPGEIAVRNFGDEVEHLAVGRRPKQLDILGVRPHQRPGGAGRPPEEHEEVRPVRLVPDLLRQQAGRGGEPFHGPEIRVRGPSRGQLVVPALPGEQRPRAPLPVPDERPAVLALPVPVVVVPPPARAVRRVHLEHGIDHAQGVLDDRIVRPPDPVPDKFQEPSVDDLLRREHPAEHPAMVGEPKNAGFGILVGARVADVAREDADVVPRDPGDERPLRGHRPRFDVTFEEVGILFEERGRRTVSPLAGEGGRADKRRDVRGDRRWRVAAGLLPPLLRCRRTVEDQIACGPHDHRIGVEVPRAPSRSRRHARRIGNATSSSWIPRQYGSPSIQKFWENPPSACWLTAR